MKAFESFIACFQFNPLGKVTWHEVEFCISLVLCFHEKLE